MRKRWLQILGVIFVAFVALWLLGSAGSATTDEERYQQWQRPIDSMTRVAFLQHHLPNNVSRILHLSALEQRYVDKNEDIEQALLTSGYLTNVDIAVTNAGPPRTQIADRLRKATGTNHVKWEFHVRSNALVVLTCRPEDVALCVRAVAGQ